ncbi:MAG: deoxyguanosinetriphosphate triphosphohydrolase [Lachnospiraceae bacterium]|nr:deoxyguanosinetriphosphate triphosphohydrolase [Lachnospiraceae bacterium]
MEERRAGFIRQEMERWEEAALSPFASLSSKSRGRKIEEPACDIRPVYQRDRDRILHCKSFRRLKHKTQVFLTPKGDHYRTRLTHTLEVAQIARTVARALRLNEELTEAIALGHDLGHAPFGHAGERALDQVADCGFAHNEQSVRVVELLEKKGQGLNLTWEVRDGIRNHPTAGQPHTLEGKIVRLADKIAYINHDIDDAIRGGILAEKDIPWDYRRILGFTTRERLNTLIHDVIYQSFGKPDIGMSEQVEKAMGDLRRFMFANVYTNPRAKGQEEKAENLLKSLFTCYMEHPSLLPEEYMQLIEKQGESQDRVVCDYIAGMTDQYATEKFQELYVPDVWSVR